MSHDAEICKLIEDIKGIVAVLDPKGYEWAEETKRARERANEEYLIDNEREDDNGRSGETSMCHAEKVSGVYGDSWVMRIQGKDWM